MNNKTFLFYVVIFFFFILSNGCVKNSNRVYFTIDPEDRKILLPIQLDDSIIANLVFDTHNYCLILDSSFCAAHPNLSLYTSTDTVRQESTGVFWASWSVPCLLYETSEQAVRIGNTNLIYSPINTYNLKKYMNNYELDGVFNIPQNDTIHVWELNFKHNYLEIHPAINFRMPDNCFLLPMVRDIYIQSS